MSTRAADETDEGADNADDTLDTFECRQAEAATGLAHTASEVRGEKRSTFSSAKVTAVVIYVVIVFLSIIISFSNLSHCCAFIVLLP
jgi:hypothetical protein